MGTRCYEVGAIRNGSFSQWAIFLFMFKGASSSDGLLVLLDRRRQAPQRMLERKPHHQRLGARSNH
jgi:hypothetical protein